MKRTPFSSLAISFMLLLIHVITSTAQTQVHTSVSNGTYSNSSVSFQFTNLPRSVAGPVSITLNVNNLSSGYYQYIPIYRDETYICGSYCCSENWLGQCTGTCYQYCTRSVIVGYDQRWTPQAVTVIADGFSVGQQYLSCGSITSNYTIPQTAASQSIGNDGALMIHFSGATINSCSTFSATAQLTYSYSVLPSITAISPRVVAYGENVMIQGTNLDGVSRVTFNGSEATYTVNNPFSISAIVPTGCTAGDVVVYNSHGASNGASFTLASPSITSISPLKGAVGSQVIITGNNLQYVSQVLMGEALADFHLNTTSVIEATVPQGGFGTIRLVSAYGTLESADRFTPEQTVIASDSLALVALYNAANGPNWTEQANWLTGPVNTWQNILVANNRVTGIAIGGPINLQGSLPSDLANLQALDRFIISNNRIDELPPWITGFPNLGALSMFNNGMAGSIPADIGNLRNLYHLDLASNVLTGEIPVSTGNLTGLFVLNLGSNRLTGEVPPTLVNLTRLALLGIESNELTGLPDLSSVRTLTNFFANDNRFTFEDFEPNRSIAGLRSSPQKLVVPPSGSQAVNEGDSAELTVSVGGSQNNYIWFRNGAQIQRPNLGSLSFEQVSLQDSGEYYVRITNPLVPGLTLESEKMFLHVTPAPDRDGDGLNAVVDCDDNNPEVGLESTWYLDADGDGYGTDHVTQLSCERPEGFVDNGSDCNDTDVSVYPSATEIDGNTIDENCDGKMGQAIALTLGNAAPTYGDQPFEVNVVTTSGYPVQLSSSNDTIATIVGNVVSVHAAGDFSIMAQVPGDTTWLPAVLQMAVNVRKAWLHVTPDDKIISYGDSIPELTITYSGFIGDDTIEDLDSLPYAEMESSTGEMKPACKVAKKEAIPNLLAAYTIWISGGADDNYYFSNNCGTLSVTKALLNVSANDTSKIYGDPNPAFTLSYTGFKNGETISVLDSLPVITTAATDSSSAGAYALEVIGGGAANYVINPVNGTFVIHQAVLTVATGDYTITYGDSVPIPVLTYTGLKLGDTETSLDIAPHAYYDMMMPAATMENPNPLANAGSYIVRITTGMDVNYSFTYVPGTLTIDKAQLLVVADNKQITYGDPVPELTISYIGFKGMDDAAVLDHAPVARFPYKLPPPPNNFPYAGQFQIWVEGGHDNNYTFQLVSGALNVSRAPLILAIDNTFRDYGDPNPAFTYTGSGFKGGDGPHSLENQPLMITTAEQFSNVGEYPIFADSIPDSNYQITIVPGTLTVWDAPLTLVIHDPSVEYGEDIFAGITYTISGFKGNDDESSLDRLPTFGFGREEAAAATKDGSQFRSVGPFRFGLQDARWEYDDNYYFEVTGGTGQITKAPLTITADHKTREYFEENPALTYQVNGLKGTEPITVIDQLPSIATTATISSDAGQYPIELSSVQDNNYEVTVVSGDLTVTKATLQVTAENLSKVYGDPVATAGLTFTGFKGSDDETAIDIAPLASHGVTVSSAAGSYPVIITPGADNNYELQYQQGSYTVTKALLQATADDKSRAYAAENPELTISYNGFVLSDSPASLGTLPTAFTDANTASAPGTYSIDVAGGGDENYDFYYVAGTLTIDPPTKDDTKSATSTFVISPANGTSNVNTLVTVIANDLAGAKLFIFEVGQQPDFSGTTESKESRNPEVQYLLQPDTKYYVRVKSDVSDWGAVTSFTTGNPLSLTYVIDPADGEGGVGTNVKMKLNEIFGASTYTVQLSTSSAFVGTPQTETSSTPAVTFKNLTKRTRYYARVSTDLSPGQWGRTTTFLTTDPAARTATNETSEEVKTTDAEIEYHIYPNPYRSELRVLVQTLKQEPVRFWLSDVSGRQMEDKEGLTNNYMVLGTEVPSGQYMLTIVTSGARKVVKVIKH